MGKENGRLGRGQIANMNICYQMYSLDYFFTSTKRLGLSSIELWGAPPHLDQRFISNGELYRLKRRVRGEGLRIVCYTPFQNGRVINLADRDKSFREFSIGWLRRSLEIASCLETDKMLVTAGRGLLDEPASEAFERAADSLGRLAKTAGRYGITLLLEPLREDESNLVCSLGEAAHMLRRVSDPALKAMADTSPMYAQGENFTGYKRTLRDDFAHVHLVDGDPDGHLALGDGNLPLKKYLEELIELGYNGTMTLELIADAYFRDPEAPLRRSLRFLSPYLEED